MKKKTEIKKAKKADSETMVVREVKRHMTALSEEFQGRVQAIGGQFSGLNNKLDKHGEILERHELAFASINKKLDTHTEMIGGLKEDIEVIKENIEIIKVDVRKRVTYAEFESLTKRVILLEKKSHRSTVK